jgi:hypothetical protein
MSLSSLVHTVADALLEAPGDSAGREMQHGSLEGAATQSRGVQVWLSP